MTNLVVLMEPSKPPWNTSLKGGKMIFNRFCIDEDAGFELSGVSYLKKMPLKMHKSLKQIAEVERKKQGKENFLKKYSNKE